MLQGGKNALLFSLQTKRTAALAGMGVWGGEKRNSGREDRGRMSDRDGNSRYF